MSLITKILPIILLGLSPSIFASELTLGATEWCPYTCSKMPNKGIVSEYVSKILEKENIKLNIKFLPWNRAIMMSKNNEIDGLLTGVESEAPHLLFTTEPTMTYRSCFFSHKKEKAKSNLAAFKTSKVGVIQDYSYGKSIDKFLKENKNVFSIKGEDPLKRLFKLNKVDRIDYFLEEEKVAKYTIKEKIYSVYCGEANPFFIGLSPKNKNSKEIIKKLNKSLKK